MIILGLILLIIGLIVDSGVLWTIGIVLLLIGAILWVLGSMDRAVGGRRHYF
jgi:membrane-bound ClpP family serine protease